MLESIQIRNFAIIDSLTLDFVQGMTALTGETGAGKSILLDAIKLISGDRADSDSIKSNQEKAEISVCFDIRHLSQASDWLREHELLGDDECIIRRILYANGRSKAYINGFNAPLSQLRELAQMLVDLHGQREHQSLQKPQLQQQLLDIYLAQPELIISVSNAFRQWQKSKSQYHLAQSGSQEREQRIDLLKLYCQELNSLALVEGEIADIQTDFKRLSNAGKLVETSAQVLGILYENDESTVHSLLSHCQHQISDQLAIDTKLSNSHELITAALIQIQEASAELRDYKDSIDLNTEQRDLLNARLSSAHDLARKHHIRSEELPALTGQLNEELETLQSSEVDIDCLQKQWEQSEAEYLFSAKALSTVRIKAAESLSKQITAVMQELGMHGGRFSIQVEPTKLETQYRQGGIDQISYLVSANPGQPLKPLSKVASGGELSRISLAIQVILSESSAIPTLIFDEVDSGVGGGIAEIVGAKLRQLGDKHQVFCVTHLPQVASQAHHHYRVEKNKTDHNTTTDVIKLSYSERLEEVARMLGGIKITEQTRAHASEMIARAHRA